MEKIESLKRKFEHRDHDPGKRDLNEMKRTSFKIKLLQVKLSISKIEEQKMRKMPSLLNIDSRPCVKEEAEKHQKLINETITDSQSLQSTIDTKVQLRSRDHVHRLVRFVKLGRCSQF